MLQSVKPDRPTCISNIKPNGMLETYATPPAGLDRPTKNQHITCYSTVPAGQQAS